MKKILFLSFVAILYIVVTYSYSFSNSFTKKPAPTVVPIFQPVNENDTSCYNEISDNSGFQEFDSLTGKLLINLIDFYNISNFFNRNNIIANMFDHI